MGVSRRPATARSTLLQHLEMKLLSELLSLSSWNSTTGSLDMGKKDFHAKYTVKEQLGKGGFGVVYSAVRRSDGLEVAVKEVSKDRLVLGHPPLRHGVWRRPLRVRCSDQQSPTHLVSAVEAKRAGEEPDHGLPQGEH